MAGQFNLGGGDHWLRIKDIEDVFCLGDLRLLDGLQNNPLDSLSPKGSCYQMAGGYFLPQPRGDAVMVDVPHVRDVDGDFYKIRHVRFLRRLRDMR